MTSYTCKSGISNSESGLVDFIYHHLYFLSSIQILGSGNRIRPSHSYFIFIY